MAVGDILDAEILGTSPHDGWTLRLRVEGWAAATGLAIVNGIGTTPKCSLAVTSLGFDAALAATTISRTVLGTALVMLPYPNFTTPDTTVVGSDLDVLIALSDWVYAKDKSGGGNSGSDPVVTALAGLLTSSLGATLAAAKVVTNSSTKAYHTPSAQWANEQRRPVNGATILELFPIHGHARNQKPVAAVRITATGATSGATDSEIVTEFSFSSIDGCPVYAATLDISTANGFTRGEVVNINAQLAPWVGDALIDTTGVPGSVDFGTLVYTVMDRVICVVDPVGGNDGTAVASPTQSVANANPAQTQQGAMTAIRAYNNATHGLNRGDGGEMQLLAGSYLHGIGGGTATHVTNGYVTITHHSSTNRAGVIFTGPNATSRFQWVYERLKNVTITLSANYMAFGASTAVFVLEGINKTSAFHIAGGDAVCDLIGCTTTGDNLANPAVATAKTRLNRKTTYTGVAFALAACRRNRLILCPTFQNCSGTIYDNTAADAGGKPIIAYLSALKHQGSLMAIAAGLTGGGVVCSLQEITGASVVVMDWGNLSCTNFVVAQNTFAGDRCNWQAGWPGVVNNVLEMFVKGNSLKWFAWKGDEYSTGFPTLTASWPVKYGVGFAYNNSEEDYSGTGNDLFPPEYAGVDGTRDVGAGYVDDQSRYGGGAGNGDYAPSPGASIDARYPFASQMFPYDLNSATLGTVAALGAIQGAQPVTTRARAWLFRKRAR